MSTAAAAGVLDSQWRPRAKELVDELIAGGALRSSEWCSAFARVPRHLFVPLIYRRDQRGDLRAIDGHDPGTGYNAALVSHRLGARGVHSVDIHPGLIAAARDRLASLGYHPWLAVADGIRGWPEHAPYDRIIATCGVPLIPIAWVDQLHPGGAILSDLQLGGASTLVRLRIHADRTATGRLLGYPGLFMAARGSADQMSRLPELTPDQLFGVREATTTLDSTILADPAFRFFLQLHLGSGRSDHYRAGDRDRASVVADDGSWAELTAGDRLVRYDGTHNPWRTVEQIHHTWIDLGRPEPTDLGLTVTPDGQYLWHRTPDSAWTHPLDSSLRRS